MSTGYTSTNITTGAEVFGADGEKVGTVAEVYSGYIVVEKGFFFPTDYYIPMSAIASADNNQVYLNLAKDAALNSGWDAQPTNLQATSYDTSMGSVTDVDRGFDASAARIETDEEIRVPVMEEELTATVREREAGAVRIEKDVVAEERTLEVPVTEERVRVERRVVDRPVSAADADAFEETVIEVPLRTEEGRHPEAGPRGRGGRRQQGGDPAHRARRRYRPPRRGLRRRGCHGRRVVHRGS